MTGRCRKIRSATAARFGVLTHHTRRRRDFIGVLLDGDADLHAAQKLARTIAWHDRAYDWRPDRTRKAVVDRIRVPVSSVGRDNATWEPGNHGGSFSIPRFWPPNGLYSLASPAFLAHSLNSGYDRQWRSFTVPVRASS